MSELINLTGRKFGNLLVLQRVENSPTTESGYHDTQWLCKCKCGKEIIVRKTALLYQNKKHCGCIKRTHPSKHGFSHTRIHSIWLGMKCRCYSTTNSEYKNYGGRGIKVCDEWLGKNGAKAFIDWAFKNGYQDNLSIERIDVNGNYEPSNCTWANIKTQANNKRNTVKININGEEVPLKMVCEITGINYSTLYGRYKNGYTYPSIIDPSDQRPKYSGKIKGDIINC